MATQWQTRDGRWVEAKPLPFYSIWRVVAPLAVAVVGLAAFIFIVRAYL